MPRARPRSCPIWRGWSTALRLPILYVTHALEEVVRLADSVVLLEAGRVMAAGPLDAIAARGDLPLAVRDDAGAVLTCRRRRARRGAAAQPAGARRAVASGAGAGRAGGQPGAGPGAGARGDPGACPGGGHGEALSLHNILPGIVRAIAEDAEHGAAMVEIEAGGAALLSRVTPDAVARLGLPPAFRCSRW